MATTVNRRGTFVLSEPDPIRETGLDKQNVMRLRINRIALIQELRVEHIHQRLVEDGILSPNDLKLLAAGSTSADKARLLVDLLPGKGKQVDWYRSFREALQNPDAGQDVKKRYKLLVEFLDNTVIHRPNSQGSKFRDIPSPRQKPAKLPRYKPLPSIKADGGPQNMLNLDEERRQEDDKLLRELKDDDKYSVWSGRFETQDSLMLVKGYFQQWIPTPDNFRSLLVVPDEHFHKLRKSGDDVDKEQMNRETVAFEKMKKLEIVTVLARRKLLPVGFELCMCDVVQDILQEPEYYHLYFKYLKSLETAEVNLLQDILNSFYSVVRSNAKAVKNSESVKQFTALAFHLVDFMTDYGYYTDAEKIMSVLMSFLTESHHLDIWMTKYRGFIKLMHLRNKNYNFVGANQAFQCAVEMTWQIRLMSFGQDILNEAEINTEVSHMLLELGSINPAFSWSQNALKDMKHASKAVVINTLCNAVMTYCARWQIKRAEKLAIFNVQLARKHFGERNPLYLKALLHYCHFSTEFRQDEAGLHIAQFGLSTAKKIYTCDTIPLALAHRAVSKAMLVLQKFDTEKYYFHAYEAVRIARRCLPDDHPMLYIFLHTAASALQWKAFHSNKDMQEATLRLAETEARHALDLVTSHYGEVSLKTAQVYSLLGQISSKMDRLQVAEDMLQTSVSLMKLCQPSSSYFRLLAAATLGTFYKIMEKPKECIMILKTVVDNIDNPGIYMKWIQTCFDNLIHTLLSLNLTTQADAVQIQLSHWLRDNPRLDTTVTIATLHEEPLSMDAFYDGFNIWGKKAKLILEAVASKEVETAGTEKQGKD